MSTPTDATATDATATAVAAIDEVIGTPGADHSAGACCQCGRSLDGSPSDDFCSENCQQVWRATHRTVVAGHEVL
jgi:hypothetical protein